MAVKITSSTGWCLRAVGITLIGLAGNITPGRALTTSGRETLATSDMGDGGPTLAALVEAYFRSDEADQRARLGRTIEEVSGGDLASVAEAVRHISLWSERPGDDHRFWFEPGDGGRIAVHYRIPADYDPANRHSMIVCVPDTGMSPTQTLAFTIDVLGNAGRGCVLITTQRPIGGSFHQPLSSTADLRLLLRETRRRIHVDSNRVFLFGTGSGGDAAWMAAIAHPDLFSGVIILSGYPRVPCPEQVYPLFLGNLRGVAVLTVWNSPDEAPATVRQRTVAAHNRAIVDFAGQASLSITGLELPGNSRDDLKPPPGAVAEMLARRAAPPARNISHWFRYPGQGHAGWLKQTRFKGRIWEAEQLSILPSPATDRGEFISDVIKAKLAYMGAQIDGQTITIETRRCARIELLLPVELVDWGRPVTVRCNGRTRHSGPISPSISTLLDNAFKEWEFQRLTVARLSFSVRTDAGRR